MMLRGVVLSLSVLATSHAAAQLVLQEEQPIQLPTACNLLAATFPGSVATTNDRRYTASQNSYWSAQQAELHPDCRFYPQGAREIQEALADILIPYNVSIAVASGGHSPTVDQGVTIDLSNFNSTTLADDGEAVILGVAARWGDVYKKLAAHNLTIAGSRTADEDIGSHVLGGGISWFANEIGWTCDTAIEMQVITPQGQILWTNAHWNDDLFWASKGTLGALGIVTQIKLPTIRDRRVFGGITSHAPKHAPLLFNALQTSVLHAAIDPAQSAYISFRWTQAKNVWSYHAFLLNTQHQQSNKVLDAFMHVPSLHSTLRTTTVLASAKELARPATPHLRRAKFTLTATSSVATMQAAHDLIAAFTAKVNHQLPTASHVQLHITYEPLTTPHLLSHPNANIFSLTPSPTHPLLLISLETTWYSPSLDAQISLAAQQLRQSLQQDLSSRRLLHSFISPAHAGLEQDHIASLPRYTRGMLERVRGRYDPDGLWRERVVGVRHV